jgi:hypothetical protein
MTPTPKPSAFQSKPSTVKRELLIAGLLFTVGVAISGASLAQLANEHPKMAQATPPLQSTPGAESKPSAPSEPTTTGARPQEVAPQPARPDADARDAGATTALPPAPAEKVAPPIQTK